MQNGVGVNAISVKRVVSELANSHKFHSREVFDSEAANTYPIKASLTWRTIMVTVSVRKRSFCGAVGRISE